jgi:hypothetical protein
VVDIDMRKIIYLLVVICIRADRLNKQFENNRNLKSSRIWRHTYSLVYAGIRFHRI